MMRLISVDVVSLALLVLVCALRVFYRHHGGGRSMLIDAAAVSLLLLFAAGAASVPPCPYAPCIGGAKP
jgi:hypothetical protein